MTIPEILSISIVDKNVLIIGPPASGKTWLCEQMSNASHLTIRTDSYMLYGYNQSMYVCLDDIRNAMDFKMNTIVEGVQGYRLLRKGVELDCYYPDIVIELEISEKRMHETYKKERDPKKIKHLQSFNAAHQTILEDYFSLENKKKPEWIKVYNDY
jgi:adenylate kinase family enzyme